MNLEIVKKIVECADKISSNQELDENDFYFLSELVPEDKLVANVHISYFKRENLNHAGILVCESYIKKDKFVDLALKGMEYFCEKINDYSKLKDNLEILFIKDKSNYLNYLSRIYNQIGEFNHAINLYENFEEKQDGHYFMLARLYLNNNDLTNALINAQEAVRKNNGYGKDHAQGLVNIIKKRIKNNI